MEPKRPMDGTVRGGIGAQMHVGVSPYRSAEPPAPALQRRLGVAGPSEKSWWRDPETRRMRRVARYKLYSAEGRLKASVRNVFCWLKRQCAWVR